MSEKHQTNEELTPKKKRAVVIYLLIIFAAAFMLVAISMFVRMRTMQEDFDAEKNEADASYAAQELSYGGELSHMERRAHAAELLLLAHNAYHRGNSRDFQGYMASLEGYTDTLSDDALEIYEELVNALKGNSND